MKDRNHVKCTAPLQIVRTEGTKTTYGYIEAQSHSIVQWTGRFSCLIPVLCILCYRCRSLQSCRLYWSQCVDHWREYRGYHSWHLEIIHETVFEDYEQNPIILYELVCISTWKWSSFNVTSNLSLLWNSYSMPFCTTQMTINDSV